MPAAKKAPAKKAAAKKRASRATGESKKAKPDEVSERGKGGKDRVAQQLRDTRIVARVAQHWPWSAIAKEAGLTVEGAKKAYRVRRESVPLALNMDPAEIIENVAEGYSMAIGDLESIAAEAMAKGQMANAIGAKKAANEARGRFIELLQATGRLPQDLGALRHLIDLRAIAIRMLDAVDAFDREVQVAMQADDPQAIGEATARAATHIRTTFEEMLGLSSSDVEGTATELPPEASPVEAG